MNEFVNVPTKELGNGLRGTRSPAGTALNLHDDRYGIMIPMRRPEAEALRDWLIEALATS